MSVISYTAAPKFLEASAGIKRLKQNLDDIGKHGKEAGDHVGAQSGSG